MLRPGLGTILSVEYEGVSGPLGGSDETDWASATAAVPANTPRLRTADLSKLDMTASPGRGELYGKLPEALLAYE
jgi:hypothetical protein